MGMVANMVGERDSKEALKQNGLERLRPTRIDHHRIASRKSRKPLYKEQT